VKPTATQYRRLESFFVGRISRDRFHLHSRARNEIRMRRRILVECRLIFRPRHPRDALHQKLFRTYSSGSLRQCSRAIAPNAIVGFPILRPRLPLFGNRSCGIVRSRPRLPQPAPRICVNKSARRLSSAKFANRIFVFGTARQTGLTCLLSKLLYQTSAQNSGCACDKDFQRSSPQGL
jgi:hypothetical protein